MKRTRWILAPSLVASALVAALPLQAQTGEVVQATPSAEAVASLNRNLASLSRNPQDVTALLGAGQAALDLGDMQAANGFFTRANMVNPRLGKAKLGLAVVQIGLKQPAEAASNFDAAEALGEPPQGHLVERGLAYDLTGQQDKAQHDYQTALRANPGNELARLRYAVSLGISGRIADADRQLEQPLASGDREAWRMRAFILAMNGRMADARKVTQSVMPKGLADALDPYMQRLPLLTTGQKASAAYYGEFPSNVLKLAAPEPTREREVQVASNTTERDNGRRDRRTRSSELSSSRQTQARQASAVSTPAAPRSASASPSPARPDLIPPPPPTRQTPPVQVAVNQPSPPVQAAPQRPQPQQQSFEAPTTVQLASTNVETAPRAAAVQGPADPGRAPNAIPPAASPPIPTPIASQPAAPPAVAPIQPATNAPAPGFSAAAQPISPVSLADALSSLEVPEQERQRTAAVADFGAVARIQDQRRKTADAAAAKAKAEAEAKAKADAAKKAEAERKAKLAANPSRNWVQIATGRDVAALAFDMRRMRRTYADAIGDLGGWTAEWGATRRLLVGPFKKPEDAKAIVTKITKSGGDAFIWQSEAGEEVAKIGGK